jgi:hypothetical protein
MTKGDLKVIEPEPCGADVVEKLEEALEKAKSGELSSVAIAIVYRDGCTGSSWSAPLSYSILIGAVARLQHRLIASGDE